MIARIISSLSIIIFGLSTLFNLTPPFQASLDQWSEPYNISESGAASQPAMVIDQEGTVNVVWLDDFNGQMLSYFSDGVWSEPQAVSFPFGTFEPRFISDDNGFIHAFWVNESNTLRYSRVLADRFGNGDAWVSPQILATSALNYDTSIDSQGFLHLGYVRSINADGIPAGIYYKRSLDSGINWSNATSIYVSQYYRSLTSDNANINLSNSRTMDSTHVLITWDIQPRRQVFYIQSADGGETWGSPVEIGSLYPNDANQDLRNVRAVSVRDSVILLWQDDFSPVGCGQSYTYSNNLGETWSQPRTMIGDLRGCALDNAFIGELDSFPLLKTTYQNEIYLSIFNGNDWSDPYLQRGLVRFLNPQTAQITTLGQQKIAIIGQSEMIMVGVEISAFSDIWVRTREISGLYNWFPPEGAWGDPELIYSREYPVHSPVMIGGMGERLYQFWSEIDTTQAPLGREAIYYSEWNGEDWLTPSAIISTSNGSARNPRVVVDSSNRFLLIWGDPGNGSLFFSWANETLAKVPAEWSEPVVLPASYLISGNYDIAVDSSGLIYVVYIVRLNEGRGVYLTRSNDLGKTWSEPISIFDGVASGWQMLDDPNIVVDDSFVLNVTWVRYQLPGSGGSLGIYSSYSRDGGDSWSDADIITADTVMWSDVVFDKEGVLLCLWQKNEPGFYATMYSTSLNEGNTWEQPESIGSTWERQENTAIANDPIGQLHLIKQIPDESGDVLLRHWEWTGKDWSIDNYPIRIDSSMISGISFITAAISQNGTLGVLLNGSTSPDEVNQQLQNIFFLRRKVERLDINLFHRLSPTPTIPSTPTIVPTLRPTSTQDLGVAVINQQPANISFIGNYGGVIVSLLITALTIFIVLVWRLYQLARR